MDLFKSTYGIIVDLRFSEFVAAILLQNLVSGSSASVDSNPSGSHSLPEGFWNFPDDHVLIHHKEETLNLIGNLQQSVPCGGNFVDSMILLS